PPHTPWGWPVATAQARHSGRISQRRQTVFAGRVVPPFSGKNASGSVCGHNAFDQSGAGTTGAGSASSASTTASSAPVVIVTTVPGRVRLQVDAHLARVATVGVRIGHLHHG